MERTIEVDHSKQFGFASQPSSYQIIPDLKGAGSVE